MTIPRPKPSQQDMTLNNFKATSTDKPLKIQNILAPARPIRPSVKQVYPLPPRQRPSAVQELTTFDVQRIRPSKKEVVH